MDKAIEELKSVAIFTKNPDECFDIIDKLRSLGLPIQSLTLKRALDKDKDIIPSYYKHKGLYIKHTSNGFVRIETPKRGIRIIKYIEFIGLVLKAKSEMEAEVNRPDRSPKG